MIKAKVSVITENKEYLPGEVIKEQLSKADLEFLKKNGFIEITDEAVSLYEDEDSEDSGNDDNSGFGIEDDDSGDGISYLDKSELKAMKKEEIIAYAATIGLDLSDDLKKDELIDSVLNFIEENEAQ